VSRCPQLGDPAYTLQMKHSWRSQPTSMIVAEYHGYGDPFFGGNADDRVLGECGTILPHAPNRPAAVFATIEEAAQAALKIPNRRPGSSLGVVPRW
jgi:hypothetical protein